MSLNVMNWSFNKKYYLKHPWKWFSELFSNLREAYRRVKYGWAYQDCWNLDFWMLEVLPPMLRHMADEGCAYPGTAPFETPEQWHDWLHSMADVLESLQEDNWFNQNEYEKDFHQLSHWHNDTNSNITLTNGQDYETLSKLYFIRSHELVDERQKLIENTFLELAKYFTMLWD